MSKLLKYLGITVGLLIALIIIIPFLVDLNDYKPQISQAAKEATGRDLTIEGDIKLSLFPWIGMELGAMQLSNAAGFGDQPFARIEGAEVKLKLMPLLKREVEMKTVTLQGLRLNLTIAEDGSNNWSDLATGDRTAAVEESPTRGSSKLAALVIGGLAITDAQVVYDDRASGARYAVEALDLTTGPVALNAPIDIELNSKLSSSKPNINGTLGIKVHVIADMEKFEQHRLENLHLTFDFNSPDAKSNGFNSSGQLTLDSSIDIDLPGQRYSLSPTTLTANITNPDLPGGKAALQLSADINANLQEQTAQLNNLKLSSYGLDIQGMISASNIMETPLLNGNLRVAEFSPRTLFKNMAIAAPVTADPKVLNKAALELTLVNTTPTAIHIKPLKLTLDETTLKGSIDAELSADKPLPAVRYQLSLDAIDADRYLAPPSKSSATSGEKPAVAPTASSGAAAAAQLPMELLRNLDIDGKANIGKLKISNLRLDEIHTTIKAKDGVIKLAPISAQLYQGSYEGNTILDARGAIPKFTLKESLQNIQAGPLLKDFMNDDMVSGKGTLNLALTAQGHSADEITKTLNGNINLSFANIAMKGLNLAGKAREARAKLKGEKLSDTTVQPTDFSEVKGTFLVNNGIVTGNDLGAKAPFARINGAGSIDLAQTTLDYMISAKIVGSAAGEGGADINALKGLTIPVRITGPFSAPRFDLQYDEMLKDKLSQSKAELKAKLDQEKAQLNEKLQQEKAKL
ncbi:MAG: AsmA family protein, partial [Pseudomonadota bacterium]|nr:AsmA family protein [Pseudomonadota bacterium]